jgi:hypothetical protein
MVIPFTFSDCEEQKQQIAVHVHVYAASVWYNLLVQPL